MMGLWHPTPPGNGKGMVLERRREELCFGPDEDDGIAGVWMENRPPGLGPVCPVEESPLCKQSCAL